MKKTLLIITIVTSILSACGGSAIIELEPTMLVPTVTFPIPLATATLPNDVSPEADNPHGITISLDKYDTLSDGYILYGNISWTDPFIPPYGAVATLAGIEDANGNEILFEYAEPGTFPTPGELRQDWAYKLLATNPATPLRLSFAVEAAIPVDGGSFTFDPGPNPKLGQTWTINQSVIVGGETIHVLSAEHAGIYEGYFLFKMQSDSNIVGASIMDFAHPPVGLGGGGGGILNAGEPFFSGFSYQLPFPKGPYTLTFIMVQLLVPGDWILTWTP